MHTGRGSALHTGIIADDLTSAADGGAPFAQAGHRVVVSLDLGAALTERDTDVAALDLDSRARGEEEAAALAAEAGRRLKGVSQLYKTMDSTLRGHVGVEVAAVLLASGRRTALVAPAFPAAGRVTLGGVQRVDGVPVHRTAFAQDPRHAVSESRVARLFDGACPGEVVELTETEMRDPSRVRHALAAARVVVADAATDADLDALVAGAWNCDGLLWVGSPGIAHALARACPTQRATVWANEPRACRPLVLVGSLHPASRAQAMVLAQDAGMQAVQLDPARAGSAFWKPEIERACSACRQVARSGGPILLQSAATAGPDASGLVASALANVVQRLVAEGTVDGLVATGGDTALAVVRALGASGLRLWHELEPGVPIGALVGPYPLPVITKAGGFGDAGTLVRLCGALRGSVLPASEERLYS